MLEEAGRRATLLSARLDALPDGALKQNSVRLMSSVQGAVCEDGEHQMAGSALPMVDACLALLTSVLDERGVPAAEESRVCSFCDRRESALVSLQLCSLCVKAGWERPRAYCGRPCQTDDWEMGHWEEHQ